MYVGDFPIEQIHGESISRSEKNQGSPLLTGSIPQNESDMAPELFPSFKIRKLSKLTPIAENRSSCDIT